MTIQDYGCSALLLIKRTWVSRQVNASPDYMTAVAICSCTQEKDFIDFTMRAPARMVKSMLLCATTCLLVLRIINGAPD